MTTLEQRRALALRIAKTIGRDPASIVAALRSRLALHGTHNQKDHGRRGKRAPDLDELDSIRRNSPGPNAPPVMPHGTDEDDLRVVSLTAGETDTLHDVLRVAAEQDHGDRNDEMDQRLDFLASDLPGGDGGEAELYPEDYDFLLSLFNGYMNETGEDLTALRKKLTKAKKSTPRRIGE